MLLAKFDRSSAAVANSGSGLDTRFPARFAKEIEMNKDQVKGRVEQAKGSVKEAAGKVVNKPNLEAEGQVDKAAGKVQSGYGDTKEKAKDALKGR